MTLNPFYCQACNLEWCACRCQASFVAARVGRVQVPTLEDVARAAERAREILGPPRPATDALLDAISRGRGIFTLEEVSKLIEEREAAGRRKGLGEGMDLAIHRFWEAVCEQMAKEADRRARRARATKTRAGWLAQAAQLRKWASQ